MSPTPIQRRLQVAFAAMTSLGTLLLGMAQEDLRLACFAALAACASVYFTDRKQWLVLNTTGANIAGIGAMALTLRDWQIMEREVLFLTLANLLIYLQCILHFRSKVARVYWMLALLSFLQVTVAAVLTIDYVFGALLVLYLFLAIKTLSLFLIHREQMEHPRKRDGAAAADPLAVPDLLTTPLHELLGRLFSLLKRRRPSETAAEPPRWPLSGAASGFVHRPRRQDGEIAASRGLVPFAIKMVIGVLLLAPLLFFTVPRASRQYASWTPSRRVGPSVMGFSENISLNDVTAISENTQDVMRVRFFKFTNGQRGEALRPQGGLWLRGAVLSRYDNGRWRPGDWYSKLKRPIGKLPRPSQPNAVLQEITIEPIRDSLVLFSVPPAFLAPEQNGNHLEIDYHAEQLFRRQELRNKKITYKLLTLGFDGARQSDLRPDRPQRRYNRDWQRAFMLRPFGEAPEDAPFVLRRPQEEGFQRERLAGLKKVADQLVSSQGLNPTQDPRRAAKALERFFVSEGGFSYSLQPPPRDPSLDPIEDFVVNNRRGHCEYFASALTLMLRSQGIPARIVVGYKNGQWNDVGEYYQVRQLNAHAWVEAWIDGKAGWLRLDPTPGGGFVAEESLFSGVWQLTDYLNYLWSHYVLGMTPSLQRETVFVPLRDTLAKLFDEQAVQSWFRDLEAALTGKGDAQSWIRLVVTASVLLALPAVLFGLYRLVARIVRRLSRGGSRGGGGRRRTPQVEFYQRLEQLLARLGMSRPESQTAREFALVAAARLSDDPVLRGVAPLPAWIVEAFYRVRYGGQPLGVDDTLRVERALAQIEAAVTDHKAIKKTSAWPAHPQR